MDCSKKPSHRVQEVTNCILLRLLMKQRSIRVAMPEAMYEKLKLVAPDHGDISKLVRDLLLKYITAQDAE